ncbi:hypothetical protein OAL09_08180, partial [Verrucomicrobia bacterium]|nr:hypothetical protein [Verrucomicrobiota bacterium]
EDDFSASFSKNLKRITVNYFAGAPDDSRDIAVTYRHEKTGITGALTGGVEQWMELAVDGETQATRQRIGAVPYALRAGLVDETARRKATKKIFFVRRGIGMSPITNQAVIGNRWNAILLPERAKKLVSIKVKLAGDENERTCEVKLMYVQQEGDLVPLEVKNLRVIGKENKLRVIPLNWELDEGVYYHLDWWSDGMRPKSPIYLEYEY